MMARSGEALERFERQTAWPMLVLSLVIIPLLVIPLVADLAPRTESVFLALDWMIWAIFALEYGIRLYLAPQKGRFIRANVIDLVVVIVPFLRPLRVARSARMLWLLRAARAGALLLRGLDAARDVLTRHKLHYTLLVAMVVTIASGILVAELERGSPEGNIDSIAEGLWWAISTVTTVGYGDTFPTTAMGRGMAVILMLVGVGLFRAPGRLSRIVLHRARPGGGDRGGAVHAGDHRTARSDRGPPLGVGVESGRKGQTPRRSKVVPGSR
jgi:voltage-gated potassium channel